MGERALLFYRKAKRFDHGDDLRQFDLLWIVRQCHLLPIGLDILDAFQVLEGVQDRSAVIFR